MSATHNDTLYLRNIHVHYCFDGRKTCEGEFLLCGIGGPGGEKGENSKSLEPELLLIFFVIFIFIFLDQRIDDLLHSRTTPQLNSAEAEFLSSLLRHRSFCTVLVSSSNLQSTKCLSVTLYFMVLLN
jgi:hypothetical protein